MAKQASSTVGDVTASSLRGQLLDGKALAAAVKRDLTARVAALRSERGAAPGLGVILVGDDPASHAYVASKEKFAHSCGVETIDRRLPANASPDQLTEVIQELNESGAVHGILLQLPLPKHLDTNRFIGMIDFKKDADGLHPASQGALMQGIPAPRPCTPSGAMLLLDVAMNGGLPGDVGDLPRASLKGLRAMVIGRSILVGKPIAMMLLERDATVMMAHSKTADLPALCKTADIVVAAVGVPQLVKGNWIKPGAIVIDVGINRMPDGKLAGDVDFASAQLEAGWITPVPGGVGPMTVAMLIKNTVDAFEREVTR